MIYIYDHEKSFKSYKAHKAQLSMSNKAASLWLNNCKHVNIVRLTNILYAFLLKRGSHEDKDLVLSRFPYLALVLSYRANCLSCIVALVAIPNFFILLSRFLVLVAISLSSCKLAWRHFLIDRWDKDFKTRDWKSFQSLVVGQEIRPLCRFLLHLNGGKTSDF